MAVRRFALLIAIAGLFLNTLDCYGTWITSKQARKCCGSGHCSPANPDPCCKIAPSGAHQILAGQQKVDVPAVTVAAVVTGAEVLVLSTMPAHRVAMELDPSPPPGLRSDNLPLLI